MSYFSMHNHSMFSCLDGYGSPKECLDRANKVGLAGFAITDHGHQCAWPYFDEIKKDYPNVKMVYGVEFYECEDISVKDADNRYWHLLAIARNEQGRKALNWLVSKSKDGFYYKQRVDLNMFQECFKLFPPNSIVVSTACLASHLAKEKDYQKCIKIIAKYKSVFPLFYLEMQSHNNKEQEEYNQKILSLSEDTNTPYVITTDSHYSTLDDEQYQQMLVRIAKDKDTLSEVYRDCYIQSEKDVHKIMDNQIGLVATNLGLSNTMEILNKIDNVNMPWSNPKLPKFPVPNGKSEGEYIRSLISEGYQARKIGLKSEAEQSIYKERIQYELGVIEQMDFTGYFLIVHEYIQWAKHNDIAVGVGRGSGAGCIINYLLFITDVDPIKYGLIFERFLNPERVSMPDIDSDFDDREKIIEHMKSYYGADYIARVINYIYITPLVAINVVASQMGIPFKSYTNISKPFVYKTWQECKENLATEIDSTIKKEPIYKSIFDYAEHLCGRVKNIGIHAGGIVVGQTPLYDYMGTIAGKNNETVICLDKRKSEPMGLIKFDILGLANLKMIREAKQDLNMNPWEMDANNSEFMNDKQSYDLICSANTDAVFQMESAGMKQLIQFVQPRTIEDLSLVIALYRPDAMKSLEAYKENKLHPENTTYWCEEVRPILEPTCGALVYQEQLMDIVRVLGGRTYGGADRFRKGIGKKDENLIRAESVKLEGEIVQNGYSKELAHNVSTLLSSMGSYLFNSSHSICYAIIGLQTAYLKSHYPTEFYKCLLNLNYNDTASLSKYTKDARDSGVVITHPDINKSLSRFSIDNNKILFGFSSISGIGDAVCEQIIKERDSNGLFKGFADMIDRCKFLNVSQVVSLIKSGAVPVSNKRMFLQKYGESLCPVKSYMPIKSVSGSIQQNYDRYGLDFSKIKTKEMRLRLINEKRKEQFEMQSVNDRDKFMADFKQKYMQNEFMWEFETLSMFISENPFEQCNKVLKSWDSTIDGSVGVIAGVVTNVESKKSKKGNQYGFITIYTSYSNLLEAVCWTQPYTEYRKILKKGLPVVLLCRKDGEQIAIEKVKGYNEWREQREREDKDFE